MNKSSSKLFGSKNKIGNMAYCLSSEPYSAFDSEDLKIKALIRQIRVINTADKKVNKENFPELGFFDPAVKSFEYFFIRFKRQVSRTAIVRILEKLAFQPATIREVLCVLRMLSLKEQKKLLRFDVVAIGSCLEKNRVQRIPYIGHRGLKLSHGSHFTKRDVHLVKREKAD